MDCPSIFSYPKHIAMKIKEWAEEDRPREKMLSPLSVMPNF